LSKRIDSKLFASSSIGGEQKRQLSPFGPKDQSFDDASKEYLTDVGQDDVKSHMIQTKVENASKTVGVEAHIDILKRL
jgi:hypothetical protein